MRCLNTLVVFVVSLACPGCTADRPTQIVVAVHSDLKAPAEMDRLTLTVHLSGSKVVDASYPLTGKGAAPLPATAAIQAGSDLSAKILVTVAAHKGGGQLLRRRARLSFIPERILLLRLDLTRACMGKTCPAQDQTCAGTGCVPMDVDPSTLPDYSDAIAFADAGPQEGGAPPKTCDNGKLDPGEPCDGKLLGGKTCAGQKFTGGTLACKAGCALDTSGCYRLLDPQGLKISGAPGMQTAPAAAFDGTKFLVVWQDHRNLSSTLSDIYAALVGLDGKVLPPGDITISRAAGYQALPSVSFDGKQFWVVWLDSRADAQRFDLLGARVDTAGKVLDPGGVVVSRGTASVSQPEVASGGGGSLAVWNDGTSGNPHAVHGARLAQSGAVVDKTGLKISANSLAVSYAASVAYTSSRFFIAWTACKLTGTCLDHADIHGAVVGTDGKIKGGVVTVSGATNGQASAAVATSGVDFLVVWSDKRNATSGKTWDIYATRIGADGKLLGSGAFPIFNQADHLSPPALAYSSRGRYLVAWTQASGGTNLDLAGVRVTGSGKTLAPFLGLSLARSKKELPRVAAGGSQLLVVWSDDRNGVGNEDIYAARVEP